MLNQNLNCSKSCSSRTLISPAVHRPDLLSFGAAFSIGMKNSIPARKSKRGLGVHRHASTGVKAVYVTPKKTATAVKAEITVLQTVGGVLTHLGLDRGMDDITDLLGRSLLVELVAADTDPKTGEEKATIKSYARRTEIKDDKAHYETGKFEIPEDFGEVGAILIENEHRTEMFLQKIVLNGLPNNNGTVEVTCNSWIHPKHVNSEKRIFFPKPYLPSETPSGITRYRERELTILRGDGTGQRKKGDREYDYDVYNDLGDPDTNSDKARPVLGGAKHPYPRRCRTGRPRSKTDPLSESRGSTVFVPRDEEFAEVKQATFSAKTVYSVLHALIPSLKATAIDQTQGFPYFTAIDNLFDEGVLLPDIPTSGFLRNIVPRLVRTVSKTSDSVLRFETPEFIDRDKFAWFRDSELARQTLAGLNPCCIKLVTEWPLKSALDPETYGPPESGFTKEIVECESKCLLTFDEILKQKRLFVLDYHDVLMPCVNKVREIKGTTLYGSRALFFLSECGSLKLLAIELTRPPVDGKPQWKQVFVEPGDATGIWLWRLAKTHVLAHDSGYHQLVSHWLRTHACTEPYIIATNRQLSAMHPIHALLKPHLRYTMEINALAREALINAGGIIESTFSPAKYSIELSSVAYDKLWRFDLEALPADLINRGMAVEDPTAPHGLKLTIEDYPYANDGLLMWDAIKQWVTDYVTHYYKEESAVESDTELQGWWTEIRTKGHEDKKDEPWWPELKSTNDLIGILTTIIWVNSCHHAAVNFGQYHFAGYFPNRPTIARSPMPVENPSEEEEKKFLERPEQFLLDCFPTQVQATTVMTVLDVLSTHSPDEEYLGMEVQSCLTEDKVITAALERFRGRLKEIEGIIDDRNANKDLCHRAGAGVVPYELLKPSSGPGVTGKGIPNSISI